MSAGNLTEALSQPRLSSSRRHVSWRYSARDRLVWFTGSDLVGDVFRVLPGSDQLSDYLGNSSVQDVVFRYHRMLFCRDGLSQERRLVFFEESTRVNPRAVYRWCLDHWPADFRVVFDP